MGSAQAEEGVQTRQKRPQLRSRQGATDDYGPKGMPDEADLRRIQARRFNVIENFGHQAVGHRLEIGEGVALSYTNDIHDNSMYSLIAASNFIEEIFKIFRMRL